MKLHRCLIVSLLTAFLSGCATCPMPLDHPDPKVAVPAEIGGIAGLIVGLPVAIVLSPVTAFLTKDKPGPSRGMAMGAPAYPFGWVAGNAVGAVPWLLFGWWGNEKYVEAQPKAYDYRPPHEQESESEQPD